MSLGIPPRRILGLVLVAMAWSAAWAGEDPRVEFLKYVFRPLSQESARLERAKRFLETTRDSIVITNETDLPWKFGFVAHAVSELNQKQSGTLTIQRLKRDGESLETFAALRGDDQPALIEPHFGTIVATPVFTRSDAPAWETFYRVCYLEDQAGKRFFFHFRKASAGTGRPRLGFTTDSMPKSPADAILRVSPNSENIYLITKGL